MADRIDISELPPKKDGSSSMWAKSSEVARIVKLRRAVHAALGGELLTGRVSLELEVRIPESQLLSIGDLDNFVTGVCDALMAANGVDLSRPEYARPEWQGVEPDHPVAFWDDSAVVSISARKTSCSGEPSYSVKLEAIEADTVLDAAVYSATRKPRRCPYCASPRVARMLWGLPSSDILDDVDAGEVVLGGCCVPLNPPSWSCIDCGTSIHRKHA